MIVQCNIDFSDKMQEARAVGCRTSDEADKYFDLKRKREAEDSSRRAKENAQNTAMTSDGGKDPASLIHGQTTFISANELDIGRCPGEELLSDAVSCLNFTLRISYIHTIKVLIFLWKIPLLKFYEYLGRKSSSVMRPRYPLTCI